MKSRRCVEQTRCTAYEEGSTQIEEEDVYGADRVLYGVRGRAHDKDDLLTKLIACPRSWTSGGSGNVEGKQNYWSRASSFRSCREASKPRRRCFHDSTITSTCTRRESG